MVSYTESKGEFYATYEAETAAELVEMVRGIKELQVNNEKAQCIAKNEIEDIIKIAKDNGWQFRVGTWK